MKKEKTNHDRLFGATKIPFEGPPMGTLRIREKIISIKMGCPVTVYISMLKYTVLNRFSNSCLQIIDKMHSKWSNSKFSKHTMFVPFEFQDVESI